MDATAKDTYVDMKAYANGETRAFLADVEELLERVSDSADAEVGRLRARLTDTLADVRRTLGQSTDGLRERARAAADLADEYVRDRPWTAIGVVAALALIVGVGVSAVARR
jgi:ElaB/YqjD/DUF883 family membrane-anchored ribosome-binding protein